MADLIPILRMQAPQLQPASAALNMGPQVAMREPTLMGAGTGEPSLVMLARSQAPVLMAQSISQPLDFAGLDAGAITAGMVLAIKGDPGDSASVAYTLLDMDWPFLGYSLDGNWKLLQILGDRAWEAKQTGNGSITSYPAAWSARLGLNYQGI